MNHMNTYPHAMASYLLLTWFPGTFAPMSLAPDNVDNGDRGGGDDDVEGSPAQVGHAWQEPNTDKGAHAGHRPPRVFPIVMTPLDAAA